MEVWDSIWSTFTAPWKQNTVIWILIAGIIGGIITQLLKFAHDVYNNLGICYYELQDYNKAIEYFNKAYAKDNKAITIEKMNRKRQENNT